MKRGVAILLVATSGALAACGGGTTSTESALPSGCQQVAKPPLKHRQLPRPPQTVSRGEPLTAVVDTTCGRFGIRLDTSGSPRTVNSFAYLARKGFYDGTIFHRIVPGFVIQGGDPLQNGRGGPGYHVTEPPPPHTTYRSGTVAMAKASVEPPGRSGSQFFVVLAPDAGLPPQYAVLGKVTSGYDVVRRIGTFGARSSGSTGTPVGTVVIRGVVVRRG